MTAVAEGLARLNYFNGLRLQADDLRVEQRFHIEVRRRLTAALFTPGIAAGLEVEKVPERPHSVRIMPGVAIDATGREIILMDAVELPVVAVPNPTLGVGLGTLVVIAYGEERSAPSDLAICAPDDGWVPRRGAPSRVVQAPRIRFLDTWPGEATGMIVLGQIALGEDCSVQDISADVRSYVTTSRPPRTVPVSLEGEKDIDAANPKVFRFHVGGDTPERAVLYLRGAAFSTLYYSELGRHTHGFSTETGPTTLDLEHSHTASEGQTSQSGEHTHNYRVDGGETTGGIDVNDTQQQGRINTDPSALLAAGMHTHTVSGLGLDTALGDVPPHAHTVAGTTDPTGAAGQSAREGPRLTHLDAMEVAYDGTPITAQLLAAINDAVTTGGWTRLGDGSGGHPLVQDGTGGIDLVRLGLDLTVGEHWFTFSVSDPGVGGKIMYNLYLS